LQIKQEDLSITGHALELRVYAEDPAENFLPSVGTLSTYRRPEGENIRLDDGYEEGMEIPIYYDPMIAKLVTYGVNRDAAIQRMIEAIEMYEIDGVETTLPFGKFVCEHEAFTSGKFDTHFVKHYFTPEALEKGNEGAAKVAAKLSAYLFERNKIQLNVPQMEHSEWQKR
jgi:propionyl-CoA carboxylase alpha chain